MVDASLRAMILDIMLKMRDEFGISFLYITHDLSTAYQISDQTYILYQGRLRERRNDLGHRHPRHPYVQLLLSSIPYRIFTGWQIDLQIRPSKSSGSKQRRMPVLRALSVPYGPLP